MSIGEDFEQISSEQWKLLARHFSYSEVVKTKSGIESVQGI